MILFCADDLIVVGGQRLRAPRPRLVLVSDLVVSSVLLDARRSVDGRSSTVMAETVGSGWAQASNKEPISYRFFGRQECESCARQRDVVAFEEFKTKRSNNRKANWDRDIVAPAGAPGDATQHARISRSPKPGTLQLCYADTELTEFGI